MVTRAFKLRFRRRLRLRKIQVEELSQQAEQGLERNFFRRLERLADVRRFVVTWLVLLGLLAGCVVGQIRALGAYYQVPSPVPGGTYSEGIVGSFTNANPIYAASAVDNAVSKLLFAGLFTYDHKNNLVGDLAESIAQTGNTYTVKLRPGLTWHDGKPLTSADVVFTYTVIQNPDAQSPLRASWQGIKVQATDVRTVTFTLPGQLSAFPYSLTTGIIPKHALAGKSMRSLRTLPFNTTQPVGAGPFRLTTLEVSGVAASEREEQIALDPFDKYHAGKPKLGRFVIHSFRDEDRLIESFRKHEVNAMAGLSVMPPEFTRSSTIRAYNLPMTAAVMGFFRTTSEFLGDARIRQALVRATDTSAITGRLEYPALPVKEPLLLGQIGYNPTYQQAPYDLASANALLDSAGWVMNEKGLRAKAGQPLRLMLTAQDSSEYANVAYEMQRQWRKAGVDLQIRLETTTDFQTTLSSSSRGYDVLLYGISIGKDPDVYVYWDSKNADVRSETRLNFSEYRSPAADAALQAGRTRSDAGLRAVKYQPFLQAWQSDAPAVGLYQPRFLYVTHGTVYGLNEHAINSEVERFTNVHEWMIRQERKSQVE
ncbi:MAG TPA: peptide ABC transporter substrate-binding protein [Candidatus Saccharimonadales bacterium]